MSKRTVIIAAVAVLLIALSIWSAVTDGKETLSESEPDEITPTPKPKKTIPVADTIKQDVKTDTVPDEPVK
jgi:hypothetical protein